jgi:hypothetical protein
MRFGSGTSKGFERDWFKDAWERYIPSPVSPLSVSNPVTFSKNETETISYPVTEPSSCYPSQTPSATHNSLINNECYRVTDKNPSSGEGMWEIEI